MNEITQFLADHGGPVLLGVVLLEQAGASTQPIEPRSPACCRVSELEHPISKRSAWAEIRPRREVRRELDDVDDIRRALVGQLN